MPILKKHESWFIFFASLALFLYGLFNRELIGHEVPFKIFTQEMLQFGPKFFPTLYGNFYPGTPGTLSFFAYLCALPNQTISTFTLLLPGAIASSLSLVLIYRIALPIDREWARISVLLALFTYQFFDSARSLSIAPFMMLSSIWAFYQCQQNAPKKYLTLPLLLGFMMQGPLGLITAASGAWAFYFSQANWQQLKKCLGYSLGLFLILCGLLALAACYQSGMPLVYAVFSEQIFTPIATADGLMNPIHIFITYALSSPLALISILLLCKTTTEKNKIFYRLLIWFLLSLLLLGLTTTQHQLNRLLPIAPALALLAGAVWIHPSRCAKISVLIFHLLCLALPFIALCLTIATIATVQLKNLSVNAHYFSAFCTLSLFALASIFILCNHPIRYAQTHAKTVIGIGLASFLATMIFIVKPIEVSLQQSKSFTVQVMMARNPDESIGFLQMNPNEEPLLFFAALPNPTALSEVTFLSTVDEQTLKPILYITTMKIFDAWPEEEKQKYTVVQTGQLGYHPVIALRRNNILNQPADTGF